MTTERRDAQRIVTISEKFYDPERALVRAEALRRRGCVDVKLHHETIDGQRCHFAVSKWRGSPPDDVTPEPSR